MGSIPIDHPKKTLDYFLILYSNKYMLRDSGGINPENIVENVIYTGAFLPEEERMKLLSKVSPFYGNDENPGKVIAHHVTLAFKPIDGIKKSDIGKIIPLKITGYVIDKKIGAQAALVELPEEIVSKPNTHITISVAEGVPPVKSNDVITSNEREMVSFEEALILHAPLGYFDGESKKVITSL